MPPAFFVAAIVGLVEVSPGVCRMELLNPDQTINVSHVQCEYFVPEQYSQTKFDVENLEFDPGVYDVNVNFS
jgi:hypothetical protein